MTVAPSPATPELLQAVKDLIYEEIWNEFNPATVHDPRRDQGTPRHEKPAAPAAGSDPA